MRALVNPDMPGVATSRILPDDPAASEAWNGVILPEGWKDRLVREATTTIRLRAAIPGPELPLNGIILLSGPPGVGKTTLARGLGSPLAQALGVQVLFIEVDTHSLFGAALGHSQKAVDKLFRTTISEAAHGGPTLVLIDEVETLVTSRHRLSFDANPADVHRAVDAALTGLDRLASDHNELLIVATTNFAEAIDEAFLSRVDFHERIPRPDQAGRTAILASTLGAMSAQFPGINRLLDEQVIRRLAAEADGLDARKLRKSVVVACTLRQEIADDFGLLTEADVLAGIEAAKGGA